MQELLHHIDLDYYRSTRLLIVHAELEQLRQERQASAAVDRRRPPGKDNGSGQVGSITARTARLAE